MQVELVEGYGVYLTKRQLDKAIDQTLSVMASSNCLGTRIYQALNKDITRA